MSLLRILCLLALLALGTARVQPLALPPPPDASVAQRLGTQLPLDLVAVDDMGLQRHLADYFEGQRPVLLVPGYYRCPQLCGLLMHGLLDALRESGLPRTRWRIVRFSIDPRETTADARARRELDLAYADSLLGAKPARSPVDLHLLTLAPADAKRLAHSAGYAYERLDARAAGDPRFAHPASVIVVTPRGVVSRYLNGIDFEPAELRVALADAAGDRIGSVTSRLALLCAHFDPRVGRHSADVMNALRGVSLLLVVGLAGWCWHRRRAHGGGA
jgi:protein SCO1